MTTQGRGAAKAALELAHLPSDESGPVFAEVWHAEAFALVVTLVDTGLFTWGEWTAALSTAIAAAQRQGDPDLGDTYYHHWLAALEALCREKHAVMAPTLDDYANRWRRAYENTPHGQPVELAAADRA